MTVYHIVGMVSVIMSFVHYICTRKMKRRKKERETHNLKDPLPFGVYEFTYADAFNIVTRRCDEHGSCLYIHSVPNHQVRIMQDVVVKLSTDLLRTGLRH